MTDLSVIILVGKEELHIKRCLEKLAPLEPRQVFVVESQRGDRTHEIAVETAKGLKWRVRECLNGRMGECLNEGGVGKRCGCSADESDSPIQTFKHSNIQTLLTTVWHAWPGNQARQFNWAVDAIGANEKCEVRNEKCVVGNRKEGEVGNRKEELGNRGEWGVGKRKEEVGIRGEDGWILRLDADEYLTEETIERLKQCFARDETSRKADCAGDSRSETGVGTSLFAKFGVSPSGDLRSENIAGLTLELKRRFCGGEIRHATNGIRQVRLFRRGMARYDEGLMDERLIVDGEVADFDGAFYDDSLMPMDEWRAKHRGYAKREAAQAVESMKTGVWTDPRKATYYKLPRYLRALAYFCIRYFLKGGFLDGYAGWMWNFWQGLWYRWMVEREMKNVKCKMENGELGIRKEEVGKRN